MSNKIENFVAGVTRVKYNGVEGIVKNADFVEGWVSVDFEKEVMYPNGFYLNNWRFGGNTPAPLSLLTIIDNSKQQINTKIFSFTCDGRGDLRWLTEKVQQQFLNWFNNMSNVKVISHSLSVNDNDELAIAILSVIYEQL